MSADISEGWEAVAEQFLSIRSNVGARLIRAWARENLPPGGAVVDVGCGSGIPISEALVRDGFNVSGIDASPTLLAAFRRNFPEAPAACEAVQDSSFFGHWFDGVIAVGLLFLLAEDDQRKAIAHMAAALRPGGRLFFSAPHQRCEWTDTLTGRISLSLGSEGYRQALADAGLTFMGSHTDEGENHYYDAAAAVMASTDR